MTIEITSTTDSKEAVASAIGDLANKSTEGEKTSASSDVQKDETKEASETSTTEEKNASEATEDLNEESQDPDADSKDDDKKPKKLTGFKKRIDKLNSKLSAKEQEIEYWKSEALKGKNLEEPQKQAVVKEAASKPRSGDFDTHEEFVEALTDWKLEEKARAQAAQQRDLEAKSALNNQVKSHNDRVNKFKEAHEDFDDVIDEVSEIRASLAVQEVILSSDHGPALMYELAKQPKEFERINSLSPMAAARELGKLEAKIQKASENSTQNKEVKTTAAPKPLTPVGAKSSGSVKKSIDDPTLTQREFEKLREEQIRERRA